MSRIKLSLTFIILIYLCNGEANKTIIMKCCQPDQYIAFGGKCQKNDNSEIFNQVVIYDKEIAKTKKKFNDVFQLLPASSRNFTTRKIVSTKYNYYLIEDGTIMLELPNTLNRWSQYGSDKFCIEMALKEVGNVYQPEVRVWTAPPERNPTPRKLDPVLLVTELLVSSVFMILVLVVYSLLPELRNLCGMILVAYVASMLGAFLTLATLNVITLAGNITRPICRAFTYMVYYFFLTSFCWMNVMSLDIWWTFRGYAKARTIHRRGETFKFGMYSLYACGLPLAMTLGMWIVDQMDLTGMPWFVKPGLMAGSNCFLQGGGRFIYLYVPMLIITGINWTLFLMTSFNIWRLSRGTAVLDSLSTGNKSAHRSHRHRFMVYLKLSVIMGINWVLEVISSLWPEYNVWYLTDTYNLLIGVSIFLIFVCKKKILKKLMKRLYSERTEWTPISKSRSTTSSVSSDTDASQDNFQISKSPHGA